MHVVLHPKKRVVLNYTECCSLEALAASQKLNERDSLKISLTQLRVKYLNELNTYCYPNELNTYCYLPYADSSHLTKPCNQLFSIPPVHFNVDLLSASYCKISGTAPKPFLVCPCRIRSTPAPNHPAFCSSLPPSISNGHKRNFLFTLGFSGSAYTRLL